MKERRPILIGAAALITVLLLLFYTLPRQRQMDALERDIEDLKTARAAAAKLVPEAAEQAVSLGVNATPNPSGWLATHAINGMEKRVAKNDPYQSGKGAELEIRSLKPNEVGILFMQLTQVNLIVKSFKLSDVNARGLWDLKVSLETPPGNPATPAAATPTPAAP